MWWLKKVTTSEWREGRPTWRMAPNICVFAAVEVAITLAIAMDQLHMEV